MARNEMSIRFICKEGGTGEALKLELHLNSEVYKREIFKIFGMKKGKKF